VRARLETAGARAWQISLIAGPLTETLKTPAPAPEPDEPTEAPEQ
jgi:hypothetical protein